MEDVEAHMKRSILQRNAAKGVYKMRMSHISRLARFPLCFTAQFGRGRGRGLSVHSGVPILVCPFWLIYKKWFWFGLRMLGEARRREMVT